MDSEQAVTLGEALKAGFLVLLPPVLLISYGLSGSDSPLLIFAGCQASVIALAATIAVLNSKTTKISEIQASGF